MEISVGTALHFAVIIIVLHQMDVIEQWEFCYNKFELSPFCINIQMEKLKL